MDEKETYIIKLEDIVQQSYEEIQLMFDEEEIEKSLREYSESECCDAEELAADLIKNKEYPAKMIIRIFNIKNPEILLELGFSISEINQLLIDTNSIAL